MIKLPKMLTSICNINGVIVIKLQNTKLFSYFYKKVQFTSVKPFKIILNIEIIINIFTTSNVRVVFTITITFLLQKEQQKQKPSKR